MSQLSQAGSSIRGSWRGLESEVPGRVRHSARYTDGDRAELDSARDVDASRGPSSVTASAGSFLDSRVLNRVVGSVFDEVPRDLLGDDPQERVLEGRSAVAAIDRQRTAIGEGASPTYSS